MAAFGPQPYSAYSRPSDAEIVAPPVAAAQSRLTTGLNVIAVPPLTESDVAVPSHPPPPASTFRYVPAGTSAIAYVPSAAVTALTLLRPARPTVTPPTPAPPIALVTRPEIVPFGAPAAGGSAKLSAGVVSSPLIAAAKKPMPRPAKTPQITSVSAPPNSVWSASRMPLRPSRKDGSGGSNDIPVVTSARAFADPTAVRRSQRVCAQISPSACTSAPPATRPKSP